MQKTLRLLRQRIGQAIETFGEPFHVAFLSFTVGVEMGQRKLFQNRGDECLEGLSTA